MRNWSNEFILSENYNLIVRTLKEEDVEAVSLIEARAFSMPWQAKDFWDMVNRDDSVYVVAVLNNKIVGCCGVTNACTDGDINNVVVDADYQHMGIGKIMLQILLEWGKKIGILQYTLEVRVSNITAICLYEKLGFVSEGIRPNFYEKPREDAMIMWKRQTEVS